MLKKISKTPDLPLCPYCMQYRGTIHFTGWINQKHWEGNMCPRCTLKYTIADKKTQDQTRRSIKNGKTYEISGW